MDREADFYELFDEQRRAAGRSAGACKARPCHQRRTQPVRRHPTQSREESTADPCAAPKRAREEKQAEGARRSPAAYGPGPIALSRSRVPPASKHPDKKPIKLWVVHVLEASPPPDAEPVEWFLLTTREITSTEQAQECLRWYCLRWRIEDWHRVLKSGCRIETLQHKTAERLKRAIAINLVIAWRIMLMTLLGRACPELPAELLFSDLEIEVLQAYAKKTESTAHPAWRCRTSRSSTRRLYRARKGCAARAPNHVAGLFRTAIPLQRPVSARMDLGLARIVGKGQG